ncbi:MAG: hypothetical protein CVU33_10405 [Betaproteobacteria bacterium HGW-Betaproteobacteria-6]|jgi:hypothetical protein|nr:MAG: hypothetical protein CVU33_10405 [Betaproteobacteria bacterium HGW-Betaproteobacteria-6]
MKLSKIASALTVAGVLATSLPANASSALFSGFGLPSSDALLTGATVVDFTSLTAGIYTSLTTGNVTFGGGGGSFVITNNLGGDYNTQGRNLQNLHGQGSTTILDFTFASPVSAFGFNFGASNEDWSLAIYDAANNIIESQILNQTWFSNAGDYFGMATSGIASARLTQLTHVNDAGADWILLDNFSYVGRNNVPEPETLLLSGLGLFALAASRRRKMKQR